MWKINDALPLIKIIQYDIKKIETEYHVLLGGSVLIEGESNKDLDLFFIPLNNHEGNRGKLYSYLEELFHPLVSIRDSPDYQNGDMWHYNTMVKGIYQYKRVDIFIQ